MNQGEQGRGVTADQRRGSMRLGKASEQRGVWVDPATQQVGAIAEHDLCFWPLFLLWSMESVLAFAFVLVLRAFHRALP